MNPSYVTIVKQDMDKLLTIRFIQHVQEVDLIVTNSGTTQEEWKA
jgi:hypothetical protein